ncbi:ferredoxin [Mycolicibacterium thermoresistibile]|uniref:Ferredoxin n=1 Tax=Mycolicibacterium thermoresistibile TaxID=1797 RepID=A0A100XIR5_MYCTH|nr:ferredoxin [Mycolicibacterium thermoresistibile]SNW19628.1 ferredoxin [Mycolicibacterium thermoresistibile]
MTWVEPVLDEASEECADSSIVVKLEGQQHKIRWPRGTKLLDALLDEGLDVPFACREGHCGACAVTKARGAVEMETNDVLDQSDLDDGLILTCQALSASAAVEINYDE